MRRRLLLLSIVMTVTLTSCLTGGAIEDSSEMIDAGPVKQPFPDGGCSLSAGFTGAEPIQENILYHPRALVNVTLELINDGCLAWPADSRLVLVEGEPVDGPTTGMEVDSMNPGESTSLMISLHAPPNPGLYRSTWQLSTNENILFGPRIPLAIEVVGEMPPRQTGKPDLAITRVEKPEDFKEGLTTSYDFVITVTNQGQGHAPESRLSCVIIENGISDTPFVPALDAGESAKITCRLPAVIEMEAGIYSMVATADTFREIIEANESYNDRLYFFRVEEAYTITTMNQIAPL